MTSEPFSASNLLSALKILQMQIGVSSRDQVTPVNGVIPDMPCGCLLEIDSHGQMWVKHEGNCPEMALRLLQGEIRLLREAMVAYLGIELGKQTARELLRLLIDSRP